MKLLEYIVCSQCKISLCKFEVKKKKLVRLLLSFYVPINIRINNFTNNKIIRFHNASCKSRSPTIAITAKRLAGKSSSTVFLVYFSLRVRDSFFFLNNYTQCKLRLTLPWFKYIPIYFRYQG